ncbi:hypothetical protein QN277_004796 [Acacia crassicarpa]|uniref:Protein kinase domain-containing protein n=1 Tax=Acacia crassicarpa TaxID=499986 RepID=A0AAE1J4H7_9FABA|nr:hypothetical protein QN277_004796 [Acacia crassicarpa]
MVMSFRNIQEPTICFSLIIFLFYSQHLFTIPVTSYSHADKFSLNCGFSGNSQTTSDGRRWEPDDDSKLFSLGGNSQSSLLNSPPLDREEVPYTAARLSHSEFTYSFDVTEGQKFVRLFFYPAAYANFDRSNSLFSVKAGHHTLLKDFNASLTADNDDDPEEKVFREYCINVEPGHRLNITFTPSTNHPDAYAFVNGIEVVAMPTDLYYNKADEKSSGIQVDDHTALEMVYRINVGQGEIQANDDDMLREWHDVYGSGYKVMQTMQDLKARYGAKLTDPPLDFLKDAAPEDVYLSAKTSTDAMTWEFKVNSMFAYKIRLHFCELDNTVQKGDRVFRILIDDTLFEPEVDVLGLQEDILVPLYKDYAVPLKQGSLKRQNLSIKLQKLPKSKYDVLLNGIEIFKISDPGSDNLGGPNPDPISSSTKPSKVSKKKTKAPMMIAVKISDPGSDNLGGPNPDPISSSTKPSKVSNEKTKAPMMIAVACAALGVIVLSVIGFFIYRRMTRGAGNRTDEESLDACHKFSIEEIRAATNDFDELSIIGRGGFGVVFKGHINKGKTSITVAIKRLKPESSQGFDEFQTEIKILSKFRHDNLVDLIGYCNDEKEMILVYEFMARGTLSDNLKEPVNQSLPWKQRLEICIGAAKALLYLHTYTGEDKQSVIHRDVKSTNILLGEDWVAKVSDFGLSKIGPDGLSRSHVTTNVKGSVGYIDPEYYVTLQLTPRSDVYSFGVVLLEVLSGKPHIFRNMEKQMGSLVDWVKKCYEKGEIEEVVDPFLKGTITPQCLNKFLRIALACLHENGKLRPSMRDVVSGLETVLKMQGRMEGEIQRDDGKAKNVDKISVTQFTRDEESGVQFSTSSVSTTTDSKCSSKVTITSSEEEQALVPAVFSELAHPTAR